MRVLFLDGYDKRNLSSRWRVYCIGPALAARGHEVAYFHLLLTPEEVPLLRLLPRVLQHAFLRLWMEVRALQARRWCRWAETVIVENAYTSPWLTRYLQRVRGGYVYDALDFDNEDLIALHCPPGWRGALQRLRMRRNHRTLLAYVDGCSLAISNNFHCIEQLRQHGRPTFMVIDPIPAAYLTPQPERDLSAPLTFGWNGSPPTTRHMAEYLDVFAEFTRAGHARFEMMEGDPELAARAGATVVPWTVDNFKQHTPRWAFGISPLPSHIPFAGRFAGKPLQYMAAGIPTITSKKGMATFLITHGETGFYADTPEEWRTWIQYLIDHPEEARRIGLNARKDFETRLSLEAQLSEYERVIVKGEQPPAAVSPAAP